MKIRHLHMIEGAKQATGLTVYAGPVEGTAIGNLVVQMIEGNEFENLQAARNAIRESFEIKEAFKPMDGFVM